MTSQNVITVGLDIGYGMTKAFADNGRRACFESRVAPAEAIRFRIDIGAQTQINGLTLHDTPEGALFVGELASKQGRSGAIRNPRDRDRVADPIVTHLTHAALAMLLPGIEHAHIRVVTGLPVAYYRDAFDFSQRLIGQHTILLDGRSLVVEIDDVLVVPQPFGALLSLLLDERGMLQTSAVDLAEGKVAVLDIGTYTTDMILVEGLDYVEARSTSVEVGVSTALEMIRKVLEDQYRVSFDAFEVEQALRRQWVTINGKRETLNGLIDERMAPIAQAIESQARTLWKISTLTSLILTGGGALALRSWLEPHFPQATFTADAAMANARGFLRYGLRQWGNGGESEG